jgi:ribosomal protein S18 acetylase RimI-like enzyme
MQKLKLENPFNIKDNCTNIQEDLSNQWLESFSMMNNLSGYHQSTFKLMMSNIIPKHCFASIIFDGRIVACGLGVVQLGYVGLFDIITDELYRRRGYGKLLIQNILNWGIKNGAHSAYLQVLLDNIPAIQLYSNLGFTESYQFWFRSKSYKALSSPKC